MHKSSFLWRPEYDITAVDGFDEAGNIPGPCDWKPTEVDGASGLHTTAREYARLLETFLDPAMRLKHPDVCQRHTAINERLGWSAGWGTADDILWQWGHHIAFNAFAAIAPLRGDGIVILTNGSKGQRINQAWINAWMETDLPAFYLYRIEL